MFKSTVDLLLTDIHSLNSQFIVFRYMQVSNVGSLIFAGKHSFERLHEAKLENFNRYGAIYRERLGRDLVQLFDPADIETVHRAEGKYPQRPPLPLPVVANRRDGEPLGLGLL
jgi:hypothetical protein